MGYANVFVSFIESLHVYLRGHKIKATQMICSVLFRGYTYGLHMFWFIEATQWATHVLVR